MYIMANKDKNFGGDIQQGQVLLFWDCMNIEKLPAYF